MPCNVPQNGDVGDALAGQTVAKEVIGSITETIRDIRALPVLCALVILSTPAFSLLAYLIIIAVATAAHWDLHLALPQWLLWPMLGSAVFVLRFLHRTVTQVNVSATTIARKSDASVPVEWLREEATQQCRRLGLFTVPDIIVFAPHALRQWSSFAQAGLADRGRVAIPNHWMEHFDERSLAFVIGHELSHIKCRHGIVRETTNSIIDVFVILPSMLICAFLMLFLSIALPVIIAMIFLCLADVAFGDRSAADVLVSFVAFGEILSNGPVVGGLKWLSGFVGVGCLLSVYGKYVARGQEKAADLVGAQMAGFQAAREWLGVLVELEERVASLPMTSARQRCLIQRWIWACIWIASQAKGKDSIRGHVACAAFLLSKLVGLISRVPGVRTMFRRVAVLWDEHPPASERLRALVAAEGADTGGFNEEIGGRDDTRHTTDEGK